MKINDILSDEELEECIEGSSNITMIRDIIERTQKETLLDVESFSEWFAYGVEGYIEAEEGTEEWEECNENNREWGECIAENINEMVVEKWTK